MKTIKKRKIVFDPESGKIFFSHEETPWILIFAFAEKEDNSVFSYNDYYRIKDIQKISIFKNINNLEEYNNEPFKASSFQDIRYIENDPGTEVKNIFHLEESECISLLYAEREDDVWIVKDKMILAGWKGGASFYDCKIFDNEFMNFDSWFRANFRSFYSNYILNRIKQPSQSVESKFYKYIMDLKNTYEIFG